VPPETVVSRETAAAGKVQPQAAQLSLFDDEDGDNDEDLFAVGTTTTTAKTTQPTAVGTSAVVCYSHSLHSQ